MASSQPLCWLCINTHSGLEALTGYVPPSTCPSLGFGEYTYHIVFQMPSVLAYLPELPWTQGLHMSCSRVYLKH